MQRVEDANGVLSFQVPGDWSVQREGERVAVAAPDQKSNVIVVSGPKEATAVGEWAAALVPELKQAMPTWSEVGRRAIEVAGREALFLRAETVTNGVAMVADYLLLHTDRHQVMLSFNGPKGELGTRQLDFAAAIASLRVEGAAPPPAAPTPGIPLPPLGQPVTHRSGAFVLAVPLDWQVAQQATGVTAWDPTRQAALMVLVSPRRATSVEQLTTTTTQWLRAQIPNWRWVGMEQTQVSGRPAVRIQATGMPGGAASAAEYVLVLGQRHQVVFMLSCPQARHAQWKGAFEAIAQSLQMR